MGAIRSHCSGLAELHLANTRATLSEVVWVWLPMVGKTEGKSIGGPCERNPLLILVAFCASRQTYHPYARSAPAVTFQVLPPVTPAPTLQCQPASGITLQVQPVSSMAVELVTSGLQPGEVPSMFYSTGINGVGNRRGEAWGFANGADQHGTFSTELTGFLPLEGQTSATWDIRLVHYRGLHVRR